MVEERIAYGIEKFLEEDFFLPENDSYCLEEKSESGRSELQVTKGSVISLNVKVP